MVEKSYPSSSWKRTFAKGFMSCFMETKFISSGGTGENWEIEDGGRSCWDKDYEFRKDIDVEGVMSVV
ncbi:hypothetical protein IGI04_010979 [Brassica rapa subsp. trilocularis]|uniref:MATH domain-containing protein n=1 Tax=Brassica rapa subsp. trilocularis TaxID=1813537 RepID=A0ABQ7N3X5_BRACM|nr:hypothetical protein IGI04_010979 [Brassica rapa subsp. trilocularis]